MTEFPEKKSVLDGLPEETQKEIRYSKNLITAPRPDIGKLMHLGKCVSYVRGFFWRHYRISIKKTQDPKFADALAFFIGFAMMDFAGKRVAEKQKETGAWARKLADEISNAYEERSKAYQNMGDTDHADYLFTNKLRKVRAELLRVAGAEEEKKEVK